MRIRILGCSGGIGAGSRTSAMLIDDDVLIDAGTGVGDLDLHELNSIRHVFLTHAHLDHSGLLPKLVRAGYRGPILSTRGTRDLCEVMLADAAGIQESEVRHLNRRNAQRGLAPVEPIYTTQDVDPTLRLFQRVKFGEPTPVVGAVTATWWPAGHLLGAAGAVDFKGHLRFQAVDDATDFKGALGAVGKLHQGADVVLVGDRRPWAFLLD